MLGLDPDRYDAPEEPRNPALGVVQIELLRRVNPHLTAFRKPVDRGTWIRGYLAEGHLVHQEGERLGADDAQVADSRERADRAVRMIERRGYHVVGDVESLRVPADLPPRPRPDTVSNEALLASATTLVADLLADVRRIAREGPPDMTTVRSNTACVTSSESHASVHLGEVVGEESLDRGVLRGLDRAGADLVGQHALGTGDRAARAGGAAAGAATVGNAAPGAATADTQKPKPKPKRWKAYKGAFFNNPHVNADRFKIERRIIDTIRHVPKGETIRIAVYSFDREGGRRRADRGAQARRARSRCCSTTTRTRTR